MPFIQKTSGGQWVTISGNHVFINGAGVITKGPAALIGKKAADRTSFQEKKNDKASRAKSSHKPSSKEKQDHAEANEHELSKKLGAKKSGDNYPADVTLHDERGKLHGVELKSMLDNGNDKITMHLESRKRKEAWAKQNKATLHTVVLDDRDTFAGGRNANQYKGHRIYYRAGAGSFQLRNMEKISSFSALKKRILGAA